MPDQETTATNLNQLWGASMHLAVCERCDWGYVLPSDVPAGQCPHCHRETLTGLEEGFDQLPVIRPPEQLIPFAISEETARQSIQTFARQVTFAPPDLKPQTLLGRLRRLYLPRWLVDGEAGAMWQAEVGFDYDVVSHQDSFDQNGGWASREVRETRIRWEPRAGRLRRAYHNISAPALDVEAQVERRLGRFDLSSAQDYRPEQLNGALVRLPNRTPADAWSDARPHFQQAASEECRRAAKADHIRGYRWSPEFGQLNWTQLLLPIYTTYYLGDDGQPLPIIIHGQSGQISGTRRASLKRAKTMTFIILAAAIGILLCSGVTALGAFWEDEFLAVAGLGVLLSVIVAMAAIAPYMIAREYNRNQARQGWLG